MYNDSLTKVVHELCQNPKARQELMEGRNPFSLKLSNKELEALGKVFSRHSSISAALVTSIVPATFWA